MLPALRSLLLLTVHAILVTAQSNEFMFPPPMGDVHDYTTNQDFIVNSKINLQWTTNYAQLSVVVYQNDNPIFQYLPQAKNISAIESIPWTVALNGFSLKNGNIFFFAIYDEDRANQGDHFKSNYFNISDNGATATSAASPSKSSSTPSRSSATSSATTPSITSPPSSTGDSLIAPALTTDASATARTMSTPASISGADPTAAASSSGGMSASTKVGVGVGVGVGVSALLIGAAIGYLVHRRRGKRAQAHALPTHVDGGESKRPLSPAGYQQSHYAPAQQEQVPTQEMEAPGRPTYEIDGQTTKYR